MQKKTLIFPLLVVVATGAYLSVDTKEVKTPNPKAAAAKTIEIDTNIKIGYYNSMEVIRESKTGKELTAQVEQKRNEYQTKFREGEAELGKKANDHRTKATTLSLAAREKAEQELMRMKRDLENKGKAYDEDLKLLVQQGQMRVFKDLTDSVYVVGRDKNMDLMKDVATGQVVVINPDKVECTTSIVKVMDVNHDKKTSGANKPVPTST